MHAVRALLLFLLWSADLRLGRASLSIVMATLMNSKIAPRSKGTRELARAAAIVSRIYWPRRDCILVAGV